MQSRNLTSSHINYRFFSCKNFSSIKFEGSGLTLWELRYEIINQRMMNAKDFELVFYDCDTGEKFEDEYAKIMKNSSIIIKRVPLWMATSISSNLQNLSNGNGGGNTNSSGSNTIGISNRPNSSGQIPPDTYICYRCAQKGHFIQNCPTNTDKTFDQMRTKTPAGVPKDFLMKIGEDHVQAVVQTKGWLRRQNLVEYRNVPEEFRCSECKGILKIPMESTCGHFFCEGCVHEKEKCIKCKKIIYSLNYSLRKDQEVKNYLEQNIKLK